jgi:hypothetical protein
MTWFIQNVNIGIKDEISFVTLIIRNSSLKYVKDINFQRYRSYNGFPITRLAKCYGFDLKKAHMKSDEHHYNVYGSLYL